jgi:nondiscriminating glutamyl-tRNA synthetase
MSENKIRVRFAPSPTGYLHIGGARTALYNWLFAKKMKGSFILRIEDTDEARSTPESVNAIIESMKWLGLEWDEGVEKSGPFPPYTQMEASDQGIYRKTADELIKNGRAYYCYCKPEELEEMRKAAQTEKKVPKYDGRCCRLTDIERKEKEAEGRKPVIRFKRPDTEKPVKFNDLIAGDVEFDSALLDDFVLIKASGVPTYNFAVVVDDHRMKISHVIRGNDHLSNTPKQVQLYEALGWSLPVFAHLSMILGPDGARLSKRHGHTSVLEYKNDGYLPQALLNYLALLGWSTTDSQQLFEPQELIEKFSIEQCGNSAATFDPAKLLWMNGEYVRKIPPHELPAIFMKWAEETGRSEAIKNWDKQLLEKVIILEQEKIKLLTDVITREDFFFTESYEFSDDAKKTLSQAGAREVLVESSTRLAQASDYSAEALEKWAREFAKEKALKNGQVFHPIRVAISGKTQGPSLFHMMELLGKDKVVARIKNCLAKQF